MKIDPNSSFNKQGIKAREELRRQVKANPELSKICIAAAVRYDCCTTDRGDQRDLSDDRKQKLRNAKKYHWTGSRWICKECKDTGDKFYIKVHFCPVFLERIMKQKQKEIEKKNQELGLMMSTVKDNYSLLIYMTDNNDNDNEEDSHLKNPADIPHDN
ncbi:MAG TPA: hypothetical protein VFJ05_07040 [Nitrososphaeraceae archaeon]|nr:hypothetical protein [Nitrososphaeraceae archaeon]